MRRKIQPELAFGPAAKGEAPSAGDAGTEARAASARPERPTVRVGPSMEAVVERDNLGEALARVRRNKGAPGVDGMTVDELASHLKDHWPEIRARLLAGTYRPQPVRRGENPQPPGGPRPPRGAAGGGPLLPPGAARGGAGGRGPALSAG